MGEATLELSVALTWIVFHKVVGIKEEITLFSLYLLIKCDQTESVLGPHLLNHELKAVLYQGKMILHAATE